MTEIIRRQVILHNTKPGHNKFYELTIFTEGYSYNVRARWGRIEHFKDGNPQSMIKSSSNSYSRAVAKLEEVTAEKKAKGYKLIKDTEDNSELYESKSVAKRVAGQTQPTFERTEHVETIVVEWWTNESIEERAV